MHPNIYMLRELSTDICQVQNITPRLTNVTTKGLSQVITITTPYQQVLGLILSARIHVILTGKFYEFPHSFGKKIINNLQSKGYWSIPASL
jgi:Fe-S cluster assembly ATPase SufC